MVKVISVSEDAYATLKHFKKGAMSFSDVILARVKQKPTEKTETWGDLIHWAETLPVMGKKERISRNVDKLVYGVAR